MDPGYLFSQDPRFNLQSREFGGHPWNNGLDVLEIVLPRS